MLTSLVSYMGIGITWMGLCVMIGAIQIQESENPVISFLFMASVWPYLMYRIFYNFFFGDPNGSIWP